MSLRNVNNPTDTAATKKQTSACISDSEKKENFMGLLKYSIVGIVFGIVFVKTEIISWFRIQEMFQLKSFHMYGVIGTAVLVGVLCVSIIKKFKIKTLQGEQVLIVKKEFDKGKIYGGLLFGFGWAMTGACPGPLFAQIGAGIGVVIVVIISALMGTWTYGLLKDKLPH
jgi:uncharacterized membrane protein YedE/YeeE